MDEAVMASRHTIDQLASICGAVDAKLLVVGDPAQLPSPDAGGAFELVAEHTGAAVLGEVRRFDHDWERASTSATRRPSSLSAWRRLPLKVRRTCFSAKRS